MSWYPVFLREMLLFRRKLFRVGYLFSAMVVPMIYLVTFGLGLGRNIDVGGMSYVAYLLPGLVAMSSMNNSYSWVSSALTLNRHYFKTFQVFVLAPVSPSAIMLGEVFAGMVKGLFASLLIICTGFLFTGMFVTTLFFLVALFLNCFLFASLGVITGMLAKSHEDTSTYNNFFILPMAFFCGTFIPVDRLPAILKAIVSILPLTHTNILIRKELFDGECLLSLTVLLFYTVLFFILGTWLINRYSE
ncbi:ABC transporter permease [Prosthecochloris sp. SCSIO W1103]|uniref:ABC transporter permease n=1 Tax=Prosthecochloris sp. SCSIO W1103 TaxID=2992244 RepID=UPI00223E545F|nr:ABC transporter permease [Prosthecochloris sp. SCSIO W1103]UZJ36461.1 ABC transporter permease [Prosthecochloris sp. SCSIO W1103]